MVASGDVGSELDPSRETKKKVHLSREARSESRRWLSILSSQGEDYGDLLKFNQLKVTITLLLSSKFFISVWAELDQAQKTPIGPHASPEEPPG